MKIRKDGGRSNINLIEDETFLIDARTRFEKVEFYRSRIIIMSYGDTYSAFVSDIYAS